MAWCDCIWEEVLRASGVFGLKIILSTEKVRFKQSFQSGQQKGGIAQAKIIELRLFGILSPLRVVLATAHRFLTL